MENTYDIIVIGAGIAGSSTAALLANDAKVLLLETESHPGYHATGRSAAYFSPSYGNKVIRTLTQASEAFFNKPPNGFTNVALLHSRSAMFIARKDQTNSLNETHTELGDNVAVLSATEARELIPILAENYVHKAIIDATGGDLDVDALLQAYLRTFRASASTLSLKTEVVGLERTKATWQVSTRTGSYRAPTIVNAAGAWADDIARKAGVNSIGLIPKRRTAVLVDAPAEFDIRNWPIVVDIDEEFYFKPDAGALLISPADETPSPACDAAPEDLDIAIAVDRFETATSCQVKRINHKWAGLRTFAADKTPVVGEDPGAQGFFWLAGQGGYGVQTAPAMAALSAALILGNTTPEATSHCIAELSPDRFNERR